MAPSCCPQWQARKALRFCKLRLKTETPEHASALLECTINNAELVNVREHFPVDIAVINPERPELLNAEKYGLTPSQCLKNLISSKDTLSRVSQLAHDVLEIFDKFPIYVPAGTNLNASIAVRH